jgi:hypothetical protein
MCLGYAEGAKLQFLLISCLLCHQRTRDHAKCCAGTYVPTAHTYVQRVQMQRCSHQFDTAYIAKHCRFYCCDVQTAAARHCSCSFILTTLAAAITVANTACNQER